MRVLWRLFRIRMTGGVDLMLYPVGGPHMVPIIRDILLLPFARLASRKLVLQFHAAGIAESMRSVDCLSSHRRDFDAPCGFRDRDDQI